MAADYGLAPALVNVFSGRQTVFPAGAKASRSGTAVDLHHAKFI